MNIRTTTLLFAFSALLSACGGGGGTHFTATPDMAQGQAVDLAQSADLSSGGCAMGQKTCSGACVDPLIDDSNCGDCGIVCTVDQTCSGGKCVAGNGMTGCHGFLLCQNKCMALDCVMACLKNTTNKGQGLASDLLMCLDKACPSTGGGICDPASMKAAACMACYSASQKMGAACYDAAKACNFDLP